MENIFLRLLNISIAAGWIVLAVIILRLLLKKAPKWISCLLWAVVGIRLILPFSIESIFSLIPSANTVDPDIVYQSAPTINTGFEAVNSAVNPTISSAFAPETSASVNPLQILLSIASWVWVIGIALMLFYTLISYVRLRLKVASAVKLKGNIYQSERVSSPFILGIIRPRIYIPFGELSEHIIAHEKAHLKRGDHFIKPIAFILLALYWFNPLMWIAYILLCRDIELACDEKVIHSMANEEKQEYSKTLLEFSIKRRSIAACPIAFGEVGVKSRIKSVMNYKKPAFWIIIAALIVCIVVSVCFLTDPVKTDTNTEREISYLKDSDSLENINRVRLISPNNDITVVMEDEVAYIKEQISKIEITSIESASEKSRSSNYCIMMYSSNTDYTTLNFSIGCREVWENDPIDPSATYKVENPSAAKEIFDNTYTDPAVIQYDNVEAAILRYNENVYLKGDMGVTVYRELLTVGSGGKMKVYLQVLYGEYDRTDDNGVEKVSGGASTVRITFEETEGLWKCLEYYERKKGNEDEFPKEALDALEKIDMDEMHSELDQKAMQLLTSVSYTYKDSGNPLKSATLTLWGKDNFQFTCSMLSSNLCMGKYTKENGKVILREDGCDNVYTFIINDKDTDTLTFDADNSTPLPEYKYGTYEEPEVCVPDGAEFNAVYNLYQSPIEDGNFFVKQNEDLTYSFGIMDNNGKMLFLKTMFSRQPHITRITEDIIEVKVQAGTGLSTNWAVYCDTQNSRVSDTFQHVLGTHGDYVIHGEGKSVIIEKVFDGSEQNSYTIDIPTNNAYLMGEFSFSDVDGDGIEEFLVMVDENLYMFKFSENKVYALTDVSSVDTDSIEWIILH